MTRKQIDTIIGSLVVAAILAIGHLFIRVDRLEFQQKYYHGEPIKP
jgi:hypothetical protein